VAAGEPRSYVGDRNVWLWYRGTGSGPYPCMSALQACELLCERLIEAQAPIDRIITMLLEGCENLAMVGLIVGLLIRHVEQAPPRSTLISSSPSSGSSSSAASPVSQTASPATRKESRTQSVEPGRSARQQPCSS
jgi:hypothetical protein